MECACQCISFCRQLPVRSHPHLPMDHRGYNAPPDYKFRVFISVQKRGFTPRYQRELPARSACRTRASGSLKAEHTAGAATISVPVGRRRQRRPRRRAATTSAAHPMAQAFVAPNPMALIPALHPSRSESSFLHGDQFALTPGGSLSLRFLKDVATGQASLLRPSPRRRATSAPYSRAVCAQGASTRSSSCACL